MQSENFTMTTAGYGRCELLKDFRRNFALGLLVSVLIHGLVILSWLVARHFGEDEGNPSAVAVRILNYSDLGPPPSVTARPVLPPRGFIGMPGRNFGTPVPVPDLEVNPEQTIASQDELSDAPLPMRDEFGESGRGFRIVDDVAPNDGENDHDPGIDEVVPVDKSPEIVTMIVPKYPEVAIRIGLEGSVSVKFLIGKDGRVIKAVIVSSTSEIFNDVTMDAAVKFVFTPAYTHAGPVKVWFEIPFRFRLKDSPLAEHR